VNDFIERFVLKSTFTPDDVDFVSMRHGWILRQHRRPEAGAYVDAWVTLDRQTEIHQADDVRRDRASASATRRTRRAQP
jgi:hypothetical protein